MEPDAPMAMGASGRGRLFCAGLRLCRRRAGV